MLGKLSETVASATKPGPFYIGTLGMLRLLAIHRSRLAMDGWPLRRLSEYQRASLRRLRDHAYAKSPFYARFHNGLKDAPLEDLPVLTKSELMDNWDDVVTDRSVTLSEVQEYISSGGWSGKFRGKYYVNMTSGTTGLRGIFVFDTTEWLDSVEATARMRHWAGLPLGLTRRTRQAAVTTLHPWHASAAQAASIQGRFAPMIRIDSTAPLDDTVAKLNEFQPEVLSTYPSLAQQLAELQVGGTLRISPRVVFTTSEVLSESAIEAVSKAWGVRPFDSYGATEGSVIASECSEHRGLHLQADRLIAEFVDEDNHPVAAGEYSAKVLITVLTSRAMPLIRYQLEDSVSPAEEACPCGRPFPLIERIQGRSTEVILLPGRSGGKVAVQPIFFVDVMQRVPSDGWQVIQEGEGRLRVSVMRPGRGFDDTALKKSLIDGLAGQGAAEVSVEIDHPSELVRNAIGKVIMIKGMKSKPSTTPPAP